MNEQIKVDRLCAACGGTGEDTCIACSHRPRYAMTDYTCQDQAHRADVFCPVCLGSGRISDAVPARDAVADAETLHAMAALAPLDWYYDVDLSECDAVLSADCSVWIKYDRDTYRYTDAAHAAFRAVPGLRG